MAQSRNLQVVISGDTKSLKRALGSVDQQVNTTGGKVTKFAHGASKAFGLLGLAAGSAAAVGMKQAVDAATDIEESLTKNDQLFGRHAKTIDRFSKDTAVSLGISRREALAATGNFGNLFETIGLADKPAANMSMRLSTLAGDLASFNNASPEETLTALRSGLVGEAEPMRRFGALLSEGRVKAEAYGSGLAKAGEELTEQEKVQARYSLILKDTQAAHGDFERTSGGLANQTKILKARFSDMSAEMGGKLLPYALKGAEYLNEFLDQMRSGEGAGGAFVSVLKFAGKQIVAFGGWLSESVRTIKDWVDAILGGVTSALGFFEKLAEGASKIPGVGDKFKGVAKDIRKTRRDLDQFRESLREKPDYDLRAVRMENRQTGEEFDKLRKNANSSMDDIERVVRKRSRQIKRELGDNSKEGKDALRENFIKAQEAVARQMERGEVKTRDGMRKIRGYLEAELKTYGMSLRDARRYTAGKLQNGVENVRGLQAGGWIGGRGLVGPDSVMVAPGAVAAPGEAMLASGGQVGAILNRHQAPLADFALATTTRYRGLDDLFSRGGTNQVGTVDGALSAAGLGGLDNLFSSVTRPHMFAAGGIVPVPGSPGEMAASSVIGKIQAILRKFPGLRLTDAYGPGHKSPGHTVYGTDADFAGPDKTMDAATRYLVGQGYLVGYDGRFGSRRWPGHGPSYVAGGNAHLHTALGGKGGALGALAELIRSPRVKGGGAAGAVVNRALALATGGANSVLEGAAMVPVAGGGDGGGAGGMGAPALRRVIAQALRHTGRYSGANAAALYRRVMQESGGNPNAVNNWDVNAKNGTPSIGLAQVIGPTFQAHRDPRLPNNQRHPLANLVAAIRYMYSRYGRVVDANGRGYRRGGRIRGVARGGRVKGFASGGRNKRRAIPTDLSGGPGLARNQIQEALSPQNVESLELILAEISLQEARGGQTEATINARRRAQNARRRNIERDFKRGKIKNPATRLRLTRELEQLYSDEESLSGDLYAMRNPVVEDTEPQEPQEPDWMRAQREATEELARKMAEANEINARQADEARQLREEIGRAGRNAELIMESGFRSALVSLTGLIKGDIAGGIPRQAMTAGNGRVANW